MVGTSKVFLCPRVCLCVCVCVCEIVRCILNARGRKASAGLARGEGMRISGHLFSSRKRHPGATRSAADGGSDDE
uniref:Putative secreted protein n=1 Tax=Anopheles marajoara TaxID=58244 RepID=A0A2M4CD18_9DIPT